MNAYATLQVSKATINGRPALRGVVDIESDKGWLGFGTVFGATFEEVQAAAYSEADRRAEAHDCTLQSLRAA